MVVSIFGGLSREAGGLQGELSLRDGVGSTYRLLAEAAVQLQEHRSRNFQFADDMQGALAKREEILTVQQYNLELMKKSILTGQRIPADREIQEKGEWW